MSTSIEWQRMVDSIRDKEEKFEVSSNFTFASKGIDKEMGFGFISESENPVDGRVVLQGPNPFLDNHYGTTNPKLGDYSPYSQIYNVRRNSKEGISYVFLRHYLHYPLLSDTNLNGIRVATSNSGTNFSGIMLQQLISSTTVPGVETTVVETKQITRKTSKSNSKLLGQMEKSNDGSMGMVIITVHKAIDIEKKGLVGKADPYVVLEYQDQKLKSKTVDNNHNPVWHFSGEFKIVSGGENEKIMIKVYDDDIGKDDFLGEYNLDVKEIIESGEMTNRTVDMEKCKSGKLVISCKFVPVHVMNNKLGQLSLIIHSAIKLDKKNKLKKADPYVVCTLGNDQSKSPTINNNSNPQWEHNVQFDIMDSSPRQLVIEVFDDDIGKDRNIGNITLDVNDLRNSNKVEEKIKLQNCKSGDLVYSAFFVAQGSPDEEEQKIVSTTTTTQSVRKQSSIGEYPEINFLNPIFIDKDYIVVETTDANAWFMVVSQDKSLPFEVNIVPFKKKTQEDSPVFFKCLPSSGFHHIKRVVHSGKNLRKCGYEKQSVVRPDKTYQFLVQSMKETINLGDFVPSTWGPDNTDLVLTDADPHQKYIDVIIQNENDKEVVLEGTISLYESIIDPA